MENLDVNNVPKSTEFSVNTDVVKLPSQGFFYKNNKDEVIVEYMTARDEDILTNPGFMKNGTQFDKLLEKKIKDKDIKVSELLDGDKNAILMHLRITGYGADYEVTVIDPDDSTEFNALVDLEQVTRFKEVKDTPDSELQFSFTLPLSKKNIKFRILNSGEEVSLNRFLMEQSKKLNIIPAIRTERLKSQIMSIEGEKSKIYISNFVDSMSPRDSTALRKYVNEVTPNLDMEYEFTNPNTGNRFRDYIPISGDFFYPN